MNEFLRQLPYLSDLSNEDLEYLCQVIETVHLPAGVTLFTEGSVGDHVYIIQEGQLEILKMVAGEPLLLAVRNPGTVIGEMALLERAPRTADVRARTDSVLLAIQQDKFDHILDTVPGLARKVLRNIVSPRWRDTARKLRQSQEKITEQARQLEQALSTLQGLHDKLEQRVEARTAELAAANELLRKQIAEREHAQHSQAIAEAASEAKSAFLAMMSHELRTPMNAVIGMTTLLLDTELTPEQRSFTETIRNSGEGLLTVINDILDFSKIEADKLELEWLPFDLRECVQDALDLLAPLAREKELELVYYISQDTPEIILGDATRLRQIIINLTNNALKFTERGEIVIMIQSRDLGDWGAGNLQGDRGGTWSRPPNESAPADRQEHQQMVELQFSVRDSGIGIPKDRLNRLFKAFSQVDVSTSRRHGGTGLGLVISQRLTELMGGKIWVESEEGVGTIFYFTIRAEAVPNLKYKFLYEAQPDLSGKRLLIIEDNDTYREILSQQAETWGMSYRDTGSPFEALNWLRQGESFDAALIDLRMPEMDGVSLAREIRRLEAGTSGELPLIMLTAVGKKEVRAQRALENIGFAGLLNKPLKPSKLYDTLTSIFRGQPILVSPDTQPQKSEFDHRMGQQWPLCILVAEDNVINQQLALTVLGRLGYRADVAANGLEVIQAVERQSYDIILMDIQMPEMDGLEATQQIRQRWPDLKLSIVAMTANATSDDRARCLAAGMNDYISKPMRLEALTKALRLAAESRTAAGDQSLTQVDGVPNQSPTATPGSGGTVLDPAPLKKLFDLLGGDTNMFVELITTFLKNSPTLLDELSQAQAKGDAAALRLAAHSLKSNSADFGATHLAALCQTLENMGRSNTLDGVNDYLQEIRAEYDHVHQALQTIKDQGGAL